jgi:probable F420-dependent oxidoreductase
MEEDHMKIGFVILIAKRKDLGRAPSYDEIRHMAIRAEESGFDSIWLYDHLLYRPEGEPTVGIWECWTILSALAEATQRVEIGTLVLCSSFRNPAILAKMAHTLDEVSGGRFILGIGAGWNKPEYDAFGIPFDHRVDRFEEALQIIRPLLKDGYVDFEGAYYQARDCEITPHGPRKGGPPLLIGSFGPRMLALTAEYADQWNTAYLDEPESLQEPLSKIRAACDAAGRDPETLEITAAVALAFPDLAQPPAFMESFLTGTVEEIAEAIEGYEAMGVSHLMFHCSPYNEKALTRLAAGMSAYRKME